MQRLQYNALHAFIYPAEVWEGQYFRLPDTTLKKVPGLFFYISV
jgi:hypothetical protein